FLPRRTCSATSVMAIKITNRTATPVLRLSPLAMVPSPQRTFATTRMVSKTPALMASSHKVTACLRDAGRGWAQGFSCLDSFSPVVYDRAAATLRGGAGGAIHYRV